MLHYIVQAAGRGGRNRSTGQKMRMLQFYILWNRNDVSPSVPGLSTEMKKFCEIKDCLKMFLNSYFGLIRAGGGGALTVFCDFVYITFDVLIIYLVICLFSDLAEADCQYEDSSHLWYLYFTNLQNERLRTQTIPWTIYHPPASLFIYSGHSMAWVEIIPHYHHEWCVLSIVLFEIDSH